MTEIEIVRGKKSTVRIKGHANYAPRGQDIVCAAVSAIFQTLCMTVGEMYTEKDGVCSVKFARRRAELKMAQQGFEMLAKKYPDNVRLNIRHG